MDAIDRAIAAGWDPFADDALPATILTWLGEDGLPEWTIALPTSTLDGLAALAAAEDLRRNKAAHLHGGCAHPATAWYRVGPHVAELCKTCGTNFRGSGKWVTRKELTGVDLSAIAESPWKVKEKAKVEPGLFG